MNSLRKINAFLLGRGVENSFAIRDYEINNIQIGSTRVATSVLILLSPLWPCNYPIIARFTFPPG